MKKVFIILIKMALLIQLHELAELYRIHATYSELDKKTTGYQFLLLHEAWHEFLLTFFQSFYKGDI